LGSNTLLYITGAAAAAGAYYYFTRPEDVDALKKMAKADAEEIQLKSRELGGAGKAHADGAYKQGQAKYEEAKVRITLFISYSLLIDAFI